MPDHDINDGDNPLDRFSLWLANNPEEAAAIFFVILGLVLGIWGIRSWTN